MTFQPDHTDYDQYRRWFKLMFRHFVKCGCHFIWIDEVAFNSK